MNQYWLCILDRTNWKVVQQKKVWGVSERHKNTISKVQINDQLLFYLVSELIDGVRLESAIGGQARVVSEPFIKKTRIFGDKSVKKTNEVFPLRIKITNIEVFKKEIPFKPLIKSLDFIKNKKRWGGHIQGAAMRTIPKEDHDRIISAK